jgi:hypothetical protein
LRERLTTGTEDRLGKALADLLENPLVTGAIGKAFDARDRAAEAQEIALGLLNLPTATDIERLTRRLRSIAQRMEGLEDGVQRIGRALSESTVERRLEAIEEQLEKLGARLSAKPAAAEAPAGKALAGKAPAGKAPAKAPGAAQPKRRRPSSQRPG